jgi:restriction system protein
VSIPDYQSLMLPLLKFSADGNPHRLSEALESLAQEFSLTEEEIKQMLASGTQRVFDNRVSWARTYLQKAGLLTSPGRGLFQITPTGQALLAQNPERIDNNLLMNYPSFVAFRSRKSRDSEPVLLGRTQGQEALNPEEELAAAYAGLRRNLEAELLEQVKNSSPKFFEQLVVDLMLAMGYGGNREDAGRAIGQTGDGGIDGVINEDRLGLDVIYLQAKRWQNTVGRDEIQKFAGALQGQRAKRGVFITTSDFTAGAKGYAASIDSRLILIDGELLARLMVEHQVGVTTVSRYEVKRVDLDYFQEE